MTSALDGFLADYPVTVEIPVQWGDMDALQHVNNIVYLKWFESARIEYLQRIKFWSRMETERLGPILASQTVKYRAPVEYPDTIIAGAKAASFDDGQIVHSYAVFSKQKGLVATTGEARLVMYDFGQQKKTNIPDDVLALLTKLES